MLITSPPWAWAWPCSEWPWPLAAMVRWEPGPISQICLMVATISETDSGCSTAIGLYWYLLPKSLAAWLRLTWSNFKCPSRGIDFSEEGMLERHKLSRMAMQLRNNIVKAKLLRNRMLCSPRMYLIFIFIFLLRRYDMMVVEGIIKQRDFVNTRKRRKWWIGECRNLRVWARI